MMIPAFIIIITFPILITTINSPFFAENRNSIINFQTQQNKTVIWRTQVRGALG